MVWARFGNWDGGAGPAALVASCCPANSRSVYQRGLPRPLRRSNVLPPISTSVAISKSSSDEAARYPFTTIEAPSFSVKPFCLKKSAGPRRARTAVPAVFSQASIMPVAEGARATERVLSATACTDAGRRRRGHCAARRRHRHERRHCWGASGRRMGTRSCPAGVAHLMLNCRPERGREGVVRPRPARILAD